MILIKHFIFLILFCSFFTIRINANDNNSYDFMFLTPVNDYFTIQSTNESVTSKNNLSLSKSTYNVDLISSDDIYNMPSRNISEALNIFPSLAIQSSVDFIQPSIPSIFGANISHTKIVLDGLSLNTQLDGTFDLSNLQIATIDKVEVANTPLSSLWGSSLGGIIYLKTKDPSDKNEAILNFSYGEFNSIRTSMELSLVVKDLKVLFIPEYSSCDGYLDEGESERTGYFLKSNYKLSDKISIEATADYNDADIGEYVQTRFGTRSEYDSIVKLGVLKIKFNDLFSKDIINAEISINSYKNEGERRFYFLDDSSNIPFSLTTYEEARRGFNGNISFELTNSILSFESNYEYTEMSTNNFLDDKDLASYYISSNYTYNFSETTTGQLFIRNDKSDAFDGELTYGAGFSYLTENNFKIGITISKDYNAPPLIFRYLDRPDRNLKSNDNLNPETADTYNLSIEKSFLEKFLLKISLYYQDMDNGIVFTEDNEDGMYYYENFDQIERKGIETSIIYSIFKDTTLRFGGTFNDIINKETDEVILSQVRRKYNLVFDSKINKNLVFTLTANYIWWNMDDFYNANDKNFIFDAKITKKLNENASFYLSCYNLFNDELYWIDVYPNPRRNIETGFKYKI